ncbi:MAG: hypothetical protein R3F37_00990 [Candidatus Competibacteraceae bacterium]
MEQREVATRLGLNPVLIQKGWKKARFRLWEPRFMRGDIPTPYVRLLELPEQEMLDRHKQLGVSEIPRWVSRPFKPGPE